MNRCTSFLPRLSLSLILGFGFFASAHAQLMEADGRRTFPADAERGVLLIDQAPHVLLNNKGENLAPGARIIGLQNTTVLPVTVTGQTLIVNYRRDNWGQINQIWLLNAAEAATPIRRSALHNKPYNSPQANARLTQDALVPFDQLPRYNESSGDTPAPAAQ